MEGILLTKTILFITLIILVIILCVAGVFLIKLLMDVSRLIINIDEAATLVKHELEPTLSELKGTLQKINSLAGATNTQVENIKNILSKVVGVPLLFLEQVRSMSGGFFKGLTAGFNMFGKK